jgi:hypothetical protein
MPNTLSDAIVVGVIITVPLLPTIYSIIRDRPRSHDSENSEAQARPSLPRTMFGKALIGRPTPE